MRPSDVAVRKFRQTSAQAVKLIAGVQRIEPGEARDRLFQMGTRRLVAQRLARKYVAIPREVRRNIREVIA